MRLKTNQFVTTKELPTLLLHRSSASVLSLRIIVRATLGLDDRLHSHEIFVDVDPFLKLNCAAPTSLPGIIQAAMSAAQPMAEAKNIKLNHSFESVVDPIFGDAQRLQQIAWNLLSNAIKFTPAGGTVEISLAQVGQTVEITVSDTGEGIPRDALPHIFDRFHQADSSITRKHGGLGLGLAIVRHLAELHGGAVVGQSDGEGAGSIFTVTLPCVNSSTDQQVDSDTRVVSSGATALSGYRILVVDDDSDSRTVLADLLELRGAQAKPVPTAQEAIEVLTEWRPHVLISDIGMPDEDGYDLIRRVRKLEIGDLRNVPAIALTGYATAEDVDRALGAGYQVHLPKPVDPNGLVNLIVSLARQNGRPTGH